MQFSPLPAGGNTHKPRQKGGEDELCLTEVAQRKLVAEGLS
jgi:hypothetical protein